jgi:hypothetical protein
VTDYDLVSSHIPTSPHKDLHFDHVALSARKSDRMFTCCAVSTCFHFAVSFAIFAHLKCMSMVPSRRLQR